MKIFKFGGASVKNAEAIKNVAAIVKQYGGNKLLVVVSAMGKTTNAIELIISRYRSGEDFTETLALLKSFHKDIMSALFSPDSVVYEKVDALFNALEDQLHKEPTDVFEYDYDRLTASSIHTDNLAQ